MDGDSEDTALALRTDSRLVGRKIQRVNMREITMRTTTSANSVRISNVFSFDPRNRSHPHSRSP